MKKIIIGEPAAEFVSGQIGRAFAPPYQAIGLEINGTMAGGVVFTSYTGEDVEVTVAGSPRAWTRAFLRRLGDYAWNELGCIRVTITTESELVARLAERLGARMEGCKRNQFGRGRHGRLFGVLREDWFLKARSV